MPVVGGEAFGMEVVEAARVPLLKECLALVCKSGCEPRPATERAGLPCFDCKVKRLKVMFQGGVPLSTTYFYSALKQDDMGMTSYSNCWVCSKSQTHALPITQSAKLNVFMTFKIQAIFPYLIILSAAIILGSCWGQVHLSSKCIKNNE